MNRRARSRLALAAAAAAPAATIVALRVLAGPGPSAASASTAPPAALPEPTPGPKALSPAQQRAAEWLAGRTPGAARSPMDHPDPPLPPPRGIAPAESPRMPDPLASAGFVLTGLVGNGDHALAAINHRIYRAGDDLGNGWTLAEIDPARRIVLVVNADGLRLELTPPPPDWNREPAP